MAGKREIKHSLGLKDPETAKAVKPDMTKAAYALLDQAKRDKATAEKPVPIPLALRSAAQIERDRQQWEHEQEQIDLASDASFAADMEIERLEPVMQAIADGIETDAAAADIARAARLQLIHERDKAAIDRDALLSSLHARYGQNVRASVSVKSREDQRVVEHSVSRQQFKSGILLLKRPRRLRIGHLQPTNLGLHA